MTVQIPWAPGALFLHLVCRLGEPRPDGSDDGIQPDLMSQAGTVTLTCNTDRIRFPESDGRKRMLSMNEWTFSIRASDGELFTQSGEVGVEVLSALTPGIDPSQFTWTAKVKPTSGKPWEVVIPANASGTVDLVELAEGGAPSSGVPSLVGRVDALEARPSAYPVQQVTLTGNLAYTLPADAPTNQVVSVVFTQDAVGGRTVTFGGNPVTVNLAAGAATLLAFWPGGRLVYPGAAGSGGGLDAEAVQDIVGAMVAAAGGSYDAAAGTITLPSSGGGGGFPVQQVSLTGSYVLDPVALGWPTTEIVTLAFTQDATGNRAVTYGSGVVMASGVSWLLAQGTAAGSEVVTTWRYSVGLAKWVCEGCWVSIAGGVPTDVTAPTVGTMAASSITNTGFTLTVSGASDAGGLHATPYAFTIDGGTTWSAYQTSPTYVVSGRPPATAHTANWRVRDAAGNVSTGTAQTVTTTATADTTPPVWSATFTPVGTPTATVATFQASAMATDDVGVSAYEVSYDNGTTWTTVTPEIDWTFQLQGVGGTTYAQTKLRAKDAAGNTSTPVLSVPSYTMAAAQALLVADDFNRADGPLSMSSSGHTWTLEEGTQMPAVKDNHLVRGFTGGTSPIVSVPVGQADMLVSANSLGGGYPVIYARLTNKATDTYKLDMGNDGITPRAYRNGASLGAPVTCQLGDKVGISVKEEGGGTRVLILVNGVQAASYLDTASPRPAATKAGLSVNHVSDAAGWDNFEVRAP